MFNNIISKIFFGRGAENKALDNGVKQNVINFVHRCSEYKRIKGKHPDINMLEHYAAGDNTQ